MNPEPEVRTWIKGGLCLLPAGGGHRAAHVDIEISAGRIAALHEPGAAPAPAPGDGVIEASSFLVAPGFVNAHTHSPDNLIRGSAPNLPLELWSLHSAAGREGRTPREVYLAALLGCIELMTTGTATVLDHIRFSPAPDPECLDAVAQAYRDSGLRAVIAPVVADRAVVETMPLDPADLPPPDAQGYGRTAAMPGPEQVRLVEAFIARWHGHQGRIHGAIGPSGPQRCSDALLELAGDVSARRDVPLHMHVLETKAQREMGLRLYGAGMIAHLDRQGLLTRRTQLVHLLWTEPGDLEIVARTGAAVIHNPVSNAKLGSGVCRLPALLRLGIPVGLGTDSACCNDSNNLLETAKWTALLHNLQSPEPADWIGPETALALATRRGAAALGLGQVTGAIAPGLAADLTLFRLHSPAFVPLCDPVRQLVQCETGAAVDTVLVAGQPVLEAGRCARIDRDAVWAEAQDLAARRRRDNAGVYASAATLAAPVERMYRKLHGLGPASRP